MGNPSTAGMSSGNRQCQSVGYRLDLLTGELFTPKVEEQIDYWKADDRDARSYLDKLERRQLHAFRSKQQLRKLVRHKRGKKHQVS